MLESVMARIVFSTGCVTLANQTVGNHKGKEKQSMNNQTTKILGGLALAAMLAGTQTVRANFGGKIFCDANCNGTVSAPLAGVTVNAYFCGTATLAGSTVSAADGSYAFAPSASMPLGQAYYVCAVVPQGYTQGSNPGNPGYACTTTCFTFAEPCDCTHD